MLIVLAHFAAYAGTIQLGHHPVDYSNARSIHFAELLDSLRAVVDRHHVVTRALKDPPNHRRVITSFSAIKYFHKSKLLL
jgi:hypothetical protein